MSDDETEVVDLKEGTVEAASAKIASLLAPPEPEPAPEPEPQVEPEQPQDNQFMQAQQQLVSYQNQLIQEQQNLQAEENAIKALRQSDPSEYAAAMYDLMQKKEQHTYKVAQLEHAAKQFDSQFSEKAMKEAQQRLANDRAYLEKAIGYTDEKGKQIAAYLKKQGLSHDQIVMMDAKSIAAHYRTMVSQKPKTLPPKKQPSIDPRVKAEHEITRRNLGSGSLQAAQERIMALGILK